MPLWLFILMVPGFYYLSVVSIRIGEIVGRSPMQKFLLGAALYVGAIMVVTAGMLPS